MPTIYHFNKPVCTVSNNKRDIIVGVQEHFNKINKGESIAITDYKVSINGWMNIKALVRNYGTEETERSIKHYRLKK